MQKSTSIDWICDLSRIAHDLIFRDQSQSLCARAWQYKNVSRFWAAWVCVFGNEHCEKSYRHYRR